jgi:DNA-binding NtrC family response regulator
MKKNGLTGAGILIVEDEPLLRKQLAALLEKQGADVTAVDSLQGAKRLLADLGFDFVLLDVNLPDGKGTDLFRNKSVPDSTSVIVMTADGGLSGAIEAMRLGAVDYLVKPFDPAELPLVIARARRARQSARLDEHRRSDVAEQEFFFGKSLASLKGQLEKILAADNRMQDQLPPVLIQGETGTGKTTIARWLHHRGPRAAQPLVEVNCPALPETLAESELFGHERGAFTDARVTRMGLFEAAHGGTLFLDELPSWSLPLQAKVLTVIEDRKIRRLGGNKEIQVDVRVIAATNRDLKQLATEGQFREDLYHRLDLLRLCIPSLRERGEEIVALAERLLDRLCKRHRCPSKHINAGGKQRLLTYPWPGNVRELAHELERAIVFEEGSEFTFEHLAAPTTPGAPATPSQSDWFNERFLFPDAGFSLEDAINRLIRHALKQSDQNVSAAARLLGVSRDYVRYRLSGKRASDQLGNSAQDVRHSPS